MRVGRTGMLAAVVLAALTWQVAHAQDQTLSSILYMNWNETTQMTGYSQCNTPTPVITTKLVNSSSATLTPLTADEEAQTTISALWFGGDVGPASNFQVVSNCSVLQLTSNGGHGTTFYTGPVPLAPNGCNVTYAESADYLHILVDITNTGYAWSVSLPTKTQVRAQTSCNGGYHFCPLATGIECSTILGSALTLNADGSPSPQASASNKSNATLG